MEFFLLIFNPLTFLIAGTLLNLLGLYVNGIVISRVNKRLIKVRESLNATTQLIEKRLHQFQSVQDMQQQGRMLGSVIMTADPKTLTPQGLRYIVGVFGPMKMQKSLGAYICAYDEPPNQNIFNEWKNLCDAAAKLALKTGDFRGYEQMDKICDDLMSKGVQRHNNEVLPKQARLKNRVFEFERSIDTYRLTALSFHAMGIFLMLFYDMPIV